MWPTKRREREGWGQPRRVGSFSGGASWFAGGPHICFKCGKAGEQRASTLAGGAGPQWAHRRYGTGWGTGLYTILRGSSFYLTRETSWPPPLSKRSGQGVAIYDPIHVYSGVKVIFENWKAIDTALRRSNLFMWKEERRAPSEQMGNENWIMLYFRPMYQ